MLYWLALALVVGVLLGERLRVGAWRARVPVRVHVHGTRGKSALTRELARRLREAGWRVLAKTTGDRPELILPDGSPRPIRRRGPARIQEHVRLLRLAAGQGVDALVVEGMALQPETVHQSEAILRATQAVVVNTRPDHAESMGRGRRGVLCTLRLMIPARGTLFTAGEAGAGRLHAWAGQRGVPCVVVETPRLGQPAALAAAVATAILAGREAPGGEAAPAGSPRLAAPDIREVTLAGLPLRLVDAFSANDVVSSRLLLAARPPMPGAWRVALLATRADRPLRTADFMAWLLREPGFDCLAPVGGHAGYALLRGLLHRRASLRLQWFWPWLSPAGMARRLLEEARERGRSGLEVVGLGNAHGCGERWRRFMAGGKGAGGHAG